MKIGFCVSTASTSSAPTSNPPKGKKRGNAAIFSPQDEKQEKDGIDGTESAKFIPHLQRHPYEVHNHAIVPHILANIIGDDTALVFKFLKSNLGLFEHASKQGRKKCARRECISSESIDNETVDYLLRRSLWLAYAKQERVEHQQGEDDPSNEYAHI